MRPYAPSRPSREEPAPRTASRRGPPHGQAWALGVAVAAYLLLAPLASAGGPAPSTSAARVLAVYQTGYVTEQSNFTVSVQVSNTTGLQAAYFAFCQLGNGVCFPAIIMSARPNGWFVGTTRVMSSYRGMTVGVSAGYNITIAYANNFNLTEPAVPNPFTNLTVVQSVTGENMFKMTVSPNVYGLHGYVTDSASGAGVAGATVSLTPGTNVTTTGLSGSYSFSGLVNGSYTVSVSARGYASTSFPVSISGQDAVKQVSLTNGTASSSHPNQGTGSTKGSSLPTVFGVSLWVVVPVVLVIVAVASYLIWRRGTGPRRPQASSEGETAGQPPAT